MPEKSGNNWPPCCSIIRYDVQNDIIEKRARQMIESSYRVYLIYYIILLFNLGAIIATAVQYGISEGFVQIIIATIYLAIWPIADFVFRHMNLYQGFKNENKKAFHYFFFAALIDVIFGLFLCTGWFSGGCGGIIATIENFNYGRILAAGFTIVSTVLTLGHVILHLKLCREVRIFYMTRCKDEKPEIDDF